MEETINKKTVANLLRGCEEGMQLYARDCGVVMFDDLMMDGRIYVRRTDGLPGAARYYLADGRLEPGGEVMLFPDSVITYWGCFRARYVVPDKDDPKAMGAALMALLEMDGGRDEGHFSCCDDPDALYYIDSVDGGMEVAYCGDGIYEYILKTGTELRLPERGAAEAGTTAFQPFDRVVVRLSDGCWFPTLFAFSAVEGGHTWHYAVNGEAYDRCVPYNELTAKLIGTTEEDWR